MCLLVGWLKSFSQMKSIQFRPLLWPTLFSIVSFLVLISLGTWKVKRVFWKNNIISNYTEKIEKNNFQSIERYIASIITGDFS